MTDLAKDQIIIPTKTGDRTITLSVFPALEGFELDRRYRVDYKLQADRYVRREYTLAVLSYASYGDTPLATPDAVDSALENWKNVEAVFHAVLNFNGVDLELAEEKARWFEYAGAELATTFIATTTNLMGPFLSTLEEPPQNG
jgi:hypothetical protein